MNRKTALLAALCLVLVAAVVAGCSSSSSGGTSGGSSTAPKTVTVTAADKGKTVEAAVGDTIAVDLEGNPTTGYTWSTDGALPPILKEDGSSSFEASSGAVGSGGTMTMKYSAAQAGSGDLKLKYWRTFETTVPPVATFQVTINVK